MIVFGKSRKEHDSNLEQCLQRISKGLRLNQSKCTFLDTTLSFLGQVFSSQCCKPDPKRVQDLQNARIPRNVHEVRSLLSMANYSSKYIANFATITSPLRELTKKNALDGETSECIQRPCTSIVFCTVHGVFRQRQNNICHS